jgi:hypothetical protein
MALKIMFNQYLGNKYVMLDSRLLYSWGSGTIFIENSQ